MQVHGMNILFFDQPEEGPEGRRIELPLIQNSHRDWTLDEEVADRLIGPQHTRDNMEAIGVESWQYGPVQTPSTMEAAIVTDMVNSP
jgi:hypothetical protein